MASVNLYITFEPERGKAVTVARVRDRSLLLDAAERAILEAESDAEALVTEDEILSELQRQDAARLRRALQLIIPEMAFAGAVQ